MYKDIPLLEKSEYQQVTSIINDQTFHKPRNSSKTYLASINVDGIDYDTSLLNISKEKYKKKIDNEYKVVVYYLKNSKYVVKLDFYNTKKEPY